MKTKKSSTPKPLKWHRSKEYEDGRLLIQYSANHEEMTFYICLIHKAKSRTCTIESTAWTNEGDEPTVETKQTFRGELEDLNDEIVEMYQQALLRNAISVVRAKAVAISSLLTLS